MRNSHQQNHEDLICSSSLFGMKATWYKVVVMFCLWTLTSVLCHQFARTFLLFDLDPGETDYTRPFYLIVCKLTFCLLLTDINVKKHRQSKEQFLFWMKVLCHALATTATNLSMALIPASSTFAIKLLEPLTSACVQRLVVATPLSKWTLVTLPLMVSGALVFASDTLTQSSFSLGISMAFVSNVILAVRNAAIKLEYGTSSVPIHLRNGNVVIVVAAVITLANILYTGVHLGLVTSAAFHMLLSCLLSGLFHVAYSYISTAHVLSHMSVLSHSIANIVKRSMTVLFLYALGQREVILKQFAGLAVCIFGLALYTYGNHKETRPSERQGLETGVARSIPIWKGARQAVGLVAVLSCLATMGQYSQHRDGLVVRHQRMDASRPVSAATIAGSSFSGPGFHKPAYLANEILYESLDVSRNETYRQFLATNLSKTPTTTDIISPHLRSSYDVIVESQRIHFNVFSELLAPFKYAILIDIAAFANKGDPAITVGEVYLIRRLGIKLLYYCNYNDCKSRNLNYIRDVASNYSDSEVVVLLQGGGNVVGYKFHDYLRQTIFNTFSQYKIILFPQTVFMREGLSKHVAFCENLYRQTDFTMMLRDRQSLSLAQKHFSGRPTFYLMPDIAFQIGAIPRFISPMYDIIWLQRVDPEAPRQTATKWPKGITVRVEAWVNWETPKGKTTMEDSFLMQTNGMIFLQRGRVVITDRLHGHIFCVLMNIPHVLIDTPYRKLSSYHETWTRDLENTVLAVDADDALAKAVGLLDKYKDSLPSIVSFMDIEENPVPQKRKM